MVVVVVVVAVVVTAIAFSTILIITTICILSITIAIVVVLAVAIISYTTLQRLLQHLRQPEDIARSWTAFANQSPGASEQPQMLKVKE